MPNPDNRENRPPPAEETVHPAVEGASDAGRESLSPPGGWHPLPVVGLGGSAGSLKALQAFFSAMPPDSGMAFVVVTHLSPDHESILAEILQRATAMPVVQVADTVKTEANRVYVIPPSKHLLMRDGHLELHDIAQLRGKRVAVDLFFRTLAENHGPHAVGIIVSGGDGDGSIGLKRIKENGGLTIAQDPGEAEHDGMPCSAIATGMTDWVLPAAEMPGRILEYQRNGRQLKLPADPDSPESPDGEDKTAMAVTLRGVLALLKARTGRDFTYYKRATILRRIGRRMQVNGIDVMPDYLKFLRVQPAEAAALLRDLLISVTNFFRDSQAFEALEREIPHLFRDKRAGDQVRVWVAGCATGEEAYSVAMLLIEYADTLDAPPSVQVFATDLDENALQRGRAGLYPPTISADVSEGRRMRFFTQESAGLRIKREIRERVLFATHDLFRDPPFSRLDLITCRNLFIYVSREMQGRALDVFHFSLRSGGRLFLGSAESADDSLLFRALDKKQRLYGRNAREGSALPSFIAPTVPSSKPFPPPLDLRPLPPVVDGGRDKSGNGPHMRLLETGAGPSAVVDANFNITHLFGQAGRYLTYSDGEATHNLLRAVHPMLKPDLRTVLLRAAQEARAVEIRNIPVDINGERRAVHLRVVVAEETAPGFFMVVFGEDGHAPDPGILLPRLEDGDRATGRLEEEVERIRRELSDTVERYEASTEELRAGQEELHAMNEELRSTGEELETGREEMNSLNEELQTVNLELNHRVADLDHINSDLRNLMGATNIATVFLDRELGIKRYTPPAVALFNLIPTDVGRPLFDLRNRLDYPSIETDARTVFESLAPLEREVRTVDGQWFLARIQPYRTVDDRIAGVVLTFVDITERRKVEQALAATREHLRLVFENARDYAIFSMDPRRRAASWSAGAEKLLGFTEAEMRGHSCDVIFTPEDQAAGAPAKEAEAALAGERSLTECWLQRRDGGRFWGSGVMMAMRDAEGRPMGFVKILRDHTEAQRILEEIQSARAEAEAAGQAKDRFLAVLSHELRTPLTPVLMTAQALQSETMPPHITKALKMIERNVLVEMRLIDDLLDMTHIIRGNPELKRETVDVHEIIAKSLDICRADLERKAIRKNLLLEADRHVMEGDFMRLQQILWNLIKNACKFAPEGGEITIRSSNGNGSLVIAVTDNGIGIGAEALEKIFEPFQQADSSINARFGGMGLGLAISKAAVTAHGGTIRAESAGQGRGATFIITLPVTEPHGTAADEILRTTVSDGHRD